MLYEGMKGSANFKSGEYSPFKDSDLMEQIHTLIETRLRYHERNGYNSSKRAKAIVHKVLVAMDQWLEVNRSPDKKFVE